MVLKATVQKRSFKQSHAKASLEKELSRSPPQCSGQLFLFKLLSISFPIHGSIKLVIINMAYTCMERHPLSQLAQEANKSFKSMFTKTGR